MHDEIVYAKDLRNSFDIWCDMKDMIHHWSIENFFVVFLEQMEGIHDMLSESNDIKKQVANKQIEQTDRLISVLEDLADKLGRR